MGGRNQYWGVGARSAGYCRAIPAFLLGRAYPSGGGKCGCFHRLVRRPVVWTNVWLGSGGEPILKSRYRDFRLKSARHFGLFDQTIVVTEGWAAPSSCASLLFGTPPGYTKWALRTIMSLPSQVWPL